MTSHTVYEVAKTPTGYASSPLTLATSTGSDTFNDSLVADADGNLFGTTFANKIFEIEKTASGYASTATTLASYAGTGSPRFLDGSLIVDAAGNLFGTSEAGGAFGQGSVYELAKTATGYASTFTIVASFNDDNGRYPVSSLVADSNGNLFGTTGQGGSAEDGTVFEITDSGFVTCFRTGTRIRTRRGDVAVEALVVGDCIVTASGATRPIRWIGHRTIHCRSHPRSGDVHPVRVAMHAFGTNLPECDLYLSPGHPVLVGADEDGAGGHLVPIMCLINGTTIERVPVDTVTYWHVELDEHDILLVEGLPAESYLDWGDRGFFTEGSDHALANPDFVVPGLAGRCRPVALDGPVVETERRRLDGVFAMQLAGAAAWPTAQSMMFALF